MPKLAANLRLLFTEVPFAERPAAAAAAGFAGVEFLYPYEHAPADVAAWVKASGLPNVLFNLPPGDAAAGGRGLAGLPGREAEFRAGVALALAYADRLGTPTLHVMAGTVPADADRAAHRATYLENLRFAARAFAERGITAVIEPLNGRDAPDYLLSRQDDAHAVCREVGEPNLKVQMDFYHAQIVEGDVATTLRRHVEDVGHVQIAGVPDRHEPDEGELSNGYLLRLLDELGYPGWVGCEYRPRGRTIDGLGWLAEWRR